MNNLHDREVVSRTQLDDGIFLVRVINNAGFPFSTIVIDGVEMYSCSSEKEEEMLKWWEKDGRKDYVCRKRDKDESMEKKRAKEYVANILEYGKEWENNDYCALICLRNKCIVLPEYGIDGSVRDDSEWAFIDCTDKQDTGLYGAVYYF